VSTPGGYEREHLAHDLAENLRRGLDQDADVQDRGGAALITFPVAEVAETGPGGVNARYLVKPGTRKSRDKLNVTKDEPGNNIDLHAKHHNDSTDHPSSRC
jgi:hypothetical protein